MEQPIANRRGVSPFWLVVAGLTTITLLAAVSMASQLASSGPGANERGLVNAVQPVVVLLPLNLVLVVGLSARSRFAHVAALAVLASVVLIVANDLARTRQVQPLAVAIGLAAAATLVTLVIDRRRYWGGRAFHSTAGVLASVDWTGFALYVVLATVAVGLTWWASFNATFGRVLPDHPAEAMVVAAAFAVLAISAGALLLAMDRLPGVILALGGLTVAFAAFAGDIGSGAGATTQPASIGMTVLALAGIVLVAKWAAR
jgi:hypothetical protein